MWAAQLHARRVVRALARSHNPSKLHLVGVTYEWDARKDDSMKKELPAKGGDELRNEYDLSQLQGGVRGKYYRQAIAGTNLVLIEPDLATLFPNTAAVNRALRVLADAAQAAAASKRRAYACEVTRIITDQPQCLHTQLRAA